MANGHVLRWDGGAPIERTSTYFGFIETIQTVSLRRRWYGPMGDVLHFPWPEDWSSPQELRLSAVDAGHFLHVMDEFADLSKGVPTPQQRGARRGQLLHHFKPASLPWIHLYMSRRSDDWRSFAAGWRTGTWLALELAPAREMRALPHAFASVDSGEGEGVASLPFHLVRVATPEPYVAARLRDIFSLAHLPDMLIQSDGDLEGSAMPDVVTPPGDTTRSTETGEEVVEHVHVQNMDPDARSRTAADDALNRLADTQLQASSE